MKRRITNFLVALMIASALSITCNSLSQGQIVLPNKRIGVGEYGTLKELRGADGRIVLGDSRSPLDEGYALGYKFTNDQTGKQEEGFLYAVGDEHSNNLEVAQAESNAATGNEVKTSVRTKDGALALTHSFTLYEKSGVLKVRRTVQSLSPKVVQLMVMKSQASSWLVGIGRRSPLPRLFRRKDLVPSLVGAGIYDENEDCYCPLPPGCFFPPLCRPANIRPAHTIFKGPNNPRPEYKFSGIGMSDSRESLRKGAYTATLYWRRGENMQDVRLQRGRTLTFDVIYRMPNQ